MRNETLDALLGYLRQDAGVLALVKPTSIIDKLQLWTNVPADQKPMIIAVATTSTPKTDWGKPVVWHLGFMLYVYTQTNAADGSAQRLRDQVVDALGEALKPGPFGAVQTLSSRVSACLLSGPVLTDEGATKAHGVAWFPITIRP
ncbi:DUF3168 domain-containing protein [Nitrospirillum viridazoti]|uniref:DUF3168 domain-containing protein n=1 Tax=Nitrospirillum viridazoti CBAmc TaxID=1441467 RepID=A0A248JS22_9PROT|nr:DUF3168 domain-containing protein [Nitrospirillum amazonense]ASG21409.1 hypothetical protein Y958_11645 [Nitrospirillum amazonense CBAmc]TWB33087.1 uncharacterized protein DUF3168 [Nitrospirillum amazonense]